MGWIQGTLTKGINHYSLKWPYAIACNNGFKSRWLQNTVWKQRPPLGNYIQSFWCKMELTDPLVIVHDDVSFIVDIKIKISYHNVVQFKFNNAQYAVKLIVFRGGYINCSSKTLCVFFISFHEKLLPEPTRTSVIIQATVGRNLFSSLSKRFVNQYNSILTIRLDPGLSSLVSVTCPLRSQFLPATNRLTNPLHAKFLSRNINVYLRLLLSFLHTDMMQVVEVLSHGKQGHTYLISAC